MMSSILNFTYCEATALFFIAQPFNTFSNLIFFMVAGWLLMAYRHCQNSLCAALMVSLIGVGSVIWHGTGIDWTVWLDILAITVFLAWYINELCLAHKIPSKARFMLVNTILTLSTAFAFLLDTWLPLKTGGFVIPALLLVIKPSWFSFGQNERYIRASGGLLVVAMVFRMIDLSMCEHFVLGTHGFWHLFSGFALIVPLKYLMNTATR